MRVWLSAQGDIVVVSRGSDLYINCEQDRTPRNGGCEVWRRSKPSGMTGNKVFQCG